MTAESLIKWARTFIKNQCPKVTDTEREIWINVGKNMCLEMMERHLEEIKDEGLTAQILNRGVNNGMD